jgi:hypothetical protein
MTNHLTRTKEAYLEMMNNLLKERMDITKMYYEVKAKVDEIDKLLMAGDSGKVSNGQAAEIMAYAELFNKRHEEPKKEAPAPREKLAVTIPIEKATNELIDGLRAGSKNLATAFEGMGKSLPKPRQATREELIVSSVEPAKEDKHILPVEPNKPQKRVGRRKFSVHSQQGVEEMVKILQKYAREQEIQVKEFYNRFNEEVVEVDFASFQAALSKAKRKDSRIGKAGYGLYIYKG